MTAAPIPIWLIASYRTVTPVNDPPLAQDDSATTAEDTPPDQRVSQ
ncbi:MAG: hypothetical protein KF778_21470 [Rhodocyclaceae bacterium]|nr:hypothetical protein [Rhodocyclaceae bacterium]